MNRHRKSSDPAPGYEIGYGKPPEATRFKPGKSGNPKGKKKGTKSIAGLVEQVLDEPIAIREGDSVKTFSKREALVRLLFARAMKGDQKAATTFFSLLKATSELLPAMSIESAPADDISAEDQLIMDRYLRSEEE
ncbi:MAG: DUF5681 domain-containing protein [Rhizobiaceae bacterium]|nr:DUF5681 domain-containing protein [Rhizobiaceae bacterium]